MSPGIAVDDMSNAGPADTKGIGDSLFGVRLCQLADSQHVAFGQLGILICLASASTASDADQVRAEPVLGNAVVDVVLPRAREKVIWANATRVIAVMAAFESRLYVPECKRKTEAMSEDNARAISKVPIPSSIFVCRPFPTRPKLRSVCWNGTILIDLLPKAFFDGFHRLTSLTVAAVAALPEWARKDGEGKARRAQPARPGFTVGTPNEAGASSR
jgi:hypothetical protein